MSNQPLTNPTLRLDASGESFDELTHVDVIQNMCAYEEIYPCPKCYKYFKVFFCKKNATNTLSEYFLDKISNKLIAIIYFIF